MTEEESPAAHALREQRAHLGATRKELEHRIRELREQVLADQSSCQGRAGDLGRGLPDPQSLLAALALPKRAALLKQLTRELCECIRLERAAYGLKPGDDLSRTPTSTPASAAPGRAAVDPRSLREQFEERLARSPNWAGKREERSS